MEEPELVDLAAILARAASSPDPVAVLSDALVAQPDSFELTRQLGRELRIAADPTRAVAVLRRAVALRPDDPHANRELGIALRLDYRLAEALAIHERLRCEHPDDDATASSLAATLTADAQPEHALPILEEVLSRDPENIDVQMARGHALVGMGRYREAVAIASSQLGRDREFTRAWLLLAEAAMPLDELEVWVRAALEAYKLDPNGARTRLWAAQAYRTVGDFDNHRLLLHAAIERHPREHGAYTLLGNDCAMQEKDEEAIAYYRRAIAIAPWSGPAQGMLAGVLIEAKRGDVDLAALEQQALERPRHGLAFYLARIHAMVGNADKAVQFGELAARTFPEGAENHYVCGQAYRVARRWDDAIEQFRRAIELYRRHGEAAFAMAQVLVDAHRLEEAEVAIELATLALGSSDPRPGQLLATMKTQ